MATDVVRRKKKKTNGEPSSRLSYQNLQVWAIFIDIFRLLMKLSTAIKCSGNKRRIPVIDLQYIELTSKNSKLENIIGIE